ncbi:uncharacterized protein BDR25DRAFT_128348 [Lindgomyces ingoldianus]|uniref:Uncharacterized protein n=1 Tax=Lindgomyces ingoldianus TaxID=673940 RepID=A0ACB6R1F7_9PLEO|nr:uncharacterized protein BDR25DRAFT_128348 [Lindgomyces ingoldianus]KAF2473083.1 hypothetical protein BDR25DRAFT_128348 [Lindgomyces ingoldianus]
MARMLGRSKSLRMLRGFQKESHQQDNGRSTPPDASIQIEVDRLKAATPVTRANSRSATPDLSQRPRTSGGPGDRGKLFHKKVTPVTLGSEDQTYNFPFPSPTKSTTVLYTAEVHEDREGVIGIALGSPTMASHWNSNPQDTYLFTNTPGTITHISSHNTFAEPVESKQEVSKPKISRWKSFFGKKSQASQQQQQPFYKLQPSPERADSHHDEEPLDAHALVQDESRSASPAVFRPDIRQSRSVLKGQVPSFPDRPRARTLAENPLGKPKVPLLRSASSPKPPPKDDWNNSPTVPHVVVSGSSQHVSHYPSARANGDKPLLDIDIPRIEMERYSVMFGSLLQPSRSSNLLVRRQGNSEKLKPLNELSMKKDEDGSRNGLLKPQRRATSPSFPKSPTVSLSLFPQPAGGHTGKTPSPRAVSVHRPRPLQRSRTAPASSPHRQNFPATPRSSDDGGKGAFHEQKPESGDTGMKTQLLTPTPSSRHSFDSDTEEVTFVVGRAPVVGPWKPQVEEPEWEIISKPSIRKNPASQDAPSSAPPESLRADNKLKTQIIEVSPRLTDTAPQNSSQATIGLARQVSVSRTAGFQRAELLKPVLVKAATDSSSLSPSSTTSSERLVDRKPLTPTLVELKNRKSQRVQLVDA